MTFLNSILNNSKKYESPFNHWEYNNALSDEAIKEIENADIPDISKHNLNYDGTRAIDGGAAEFREGIASGGKAIKFRCFVTKENASQFPNLVKFITELQSKETCNAISEMIDTSAKTNGPSHVGSKINQDTPTISAHRNESKGKTFITHADIGDASPTLSNPALNEKTSQKANFIPEATTRIPDEETVADAAETTVRRPSSLINRISSLWTNKPDNEQTRLVKANSDDSFLDEAASKDQIAVSILDLPRSAAVNQDEETGLKSSPDLDDNELDIPAFLRRQAN